jgi:pilus assembly protein CpaE
MSVKGGCGSTLLATNLGAARAVVEETCLVDLDLCKGDVASFLDLPTEHSITTVLDQIRVADEQLLQNAVEVHASNLHVLSQPYDLTELREADADDVRMLLALLRDRYDHVLVDAGSRIDTASLTAAMEADQVVLVATPEVPTIRNLRRVSELLLNVGVSRHHLRVVVNKFDGHAAVSVNEIEEQVGLPVTTTLPADHRACRLVDDSGSLLTEVAPSRPLARAMEALWAQVHGQAPPAAPARSWFWSSRR